MPLDLALNESIQVPAFTRISDYCGLWSIGDEPFAAIWAMAQAIDFSKHQLPKRQRLTFCLDSQCTDFDLAAESVRSWMRDEETFIALEMTPAPGGKSLAVIKLTGLMMKSASSLGGTSTIQARREIRMAAADPNVAGILLAIDSPGGSVAGTHDLANEIKAAANRKPVWSHIEDMGGSAAYWAASQADQIMVNSPTALVGSIGTFQVVHDRSGEAEKAGIKTLVFRTGHLKGMGAPGEKVTDEQASHIQALVNSVQGTFDTAVQKGRKLSVKQLADVKDGGAYAAPDAQNRGLIDAIQPLGKTISDLNQAVKSNGQRMIAAGPSSTISLPRIRRQLPTLQKQGDSR